MACEKFSVTVSLDTGPPYVSTLVGALEPPTFARAEPAPEALVAEIWIGFVSANAPLTSRPVAFEDASATLSVASPAVEMTLAEEVAVYVLATPGVNAPNAGALPSDSESVAGTVPPVLVGTSCE